MALIYVCLETKLAHLEKQDEEKETKLVHAACAEMKAFVFELQAV